MDLKDRAELVRGALEEKRYRRLRGFRKPGDVSGDDRSDADAYYEGNTGRQYSAAAGRQSRRSATPRTLRGKFPRRLRGFRKPGDVIGADDRSDADAYYEGNTGRRYSAAAGRQTRPSRTRRIIRDKF
ncbi:MAG TPA: hypothetical protein PKY87_15435 [Terricaulis sp.]|nr:hypothetical protein [Terricaulis sp.]